MTKELKLTQENMNALQHLAEQLVYHFDQEITDHVEGFEKAVWVDAFLKVDELFFDKENTEAYKEEPIIDWDSERKSRRDLEEYK